MTKFIALLTYCTTIPFNIKHIGFGETIALIYIVSLISEIYKLLMAKTNQITVIEMLLLTGIFVLKNESKYF